jgi:phospholipid/cholesterol/gamma-HCH transport system substrate-binding protein
VERRYLVRVRADSIAHLSSKGLLGDTIINISVGSGGAAQLEDGAELRSAESSSTAEVIGDVKEAVAALRSLTTKVAARVDVLFSDEVAHDVQRTLHALAGVSEEVQRGHGLAHTLFYDPKLAADTSRVMSGGEHLVADVDQAVGHVRRILATVEQKPGLIHGLIYDEAGAATVVELRRAASEIANLTGEVRGGKGLLHSLVYDPDQAALVKNLTALSETLRKMGDDVARGQGTIGGLLRDPSIYEDLKLIFGKVERSTLLKALVRYTIKSDGLKP